MKKLSFSVALSLFALCSVHSQGRITSMINTTNGGSASLLEKIGKKESENATGSPYTTTAFGLANISSVSETLQVKYNAYSDEMEVNTGDGKIFILPKKEDFNTITLKGNKEKYILANYKNDSGKDASGYFIEKTAGTNGVTLLKKEKIVLIPEKQPLNGYGSYVPPKYERKDDEFYIRLQDGKIQEFPKNKKKLQELFGSKKAEIDTFVKENDISFKKEADVVKLTQFVGNF